MDARTAKNMAEFVEGILTLIKNPDDAKKMIKTVKEQYGLTEDIIKERNDALDIIQKAKIVETENLKEANKLNALNEEHESKIAERIKSEEALEKRTKALAEEKKAHAKSVKDLETKQLQSDNAAKAIEARDISVSTREVNVSKRELLVQEREDKLNKAAALIA